MIFVVFLSAAHEGLHDRVLRQASERLSCQEIMV